MATCDVCVHLSDIMTPQSFSSLIQTLIKYLVYEKQLIPYPYDRLKLYVQKYKELNFEVSCTRQLCFIVLVTVIDNYNVQSNTTYKMLNNWVSHFYLFKQENSRCNLKNKYRLESEKYYKKVSDAIESLETVFQVIITTYYILLDYKVRPWLISNCALSRLPSPRYDYLNVKHDYLHV